MYGIGIWLLELDDGKDHFYGMLMNKRMNDGLMRCTVLTMLQNKEIKIASAS
jgi:hypothetical protein